MSKRSVSVRGVFTANSGMPCVFSQGRRLLTWHVGGGVPRWPVKVSVVGC